MLGIGAIALATTCTSWAQETEEGFTPLFTGKNLDGWEGNLDYFRIEDDAIVAGTLTRKIPHNEFLCTQKTYSDFELRLQVKTPVDKINAGIQFRSRRTPGETEVIGYQADVGFLPERNIWGSLYDEARRRKMLATPDQADIVKAYKPGEWNDYVIRCEGPRIQIWVNNLQTVDYTERESIIDTDGVIGLQIHSGPPAEAWYRKVRIKTLDVADASTK
jgi:hypothetical protein